MESIASALRYGRWSASSLPHRLLHRYSSAPVDLTTNFPHISSKLVNFSNLRIGDRYSLNFSPDVYREAKRDKSLHQRCCRAADLRQYESGLISSSFLSSAFLCEAAHLPLTLSTTTSSSAKDCSQTTATDDSQTTATVDEDQSIR